MIDSIRLQNFRSYRDASFEFEKGVNIIVGPNASGKTNLLESIMVLAAGKSFRVKDNELVQFNKPWARLDGSFGGRPRSAKIIFEEDRAVKTFGIDDKDYKRLSLDKTIPVVLFEPNHLQLASRGPQFRRDFFDNVLERTKIGYKSLLSRYQRTLSQRNALLKQSPTQARKQLFAWDIRLSELGSQVAASRSELAEAINKNITRNYNKIAGKRTTTSFTYDACFSIGNYSSQMMSKLERTSRDDFARGFTAYGPHREDFILYLNKKPAQATASRGEIRSLLIVLKVFELGLVEKVRSAKPIFLLDDVFSELDGARRRHLVDYLKDYQTIITTTDAEAVVAYFGNEHKLLPL